jgi:REP-associated tyrosine transposase
MRRRRPPRLSVALYVGKQAYSLTICCEAREPLLDQRAAREIVLRQLQDTSEQHAFAIVAYCMMPDHLHVIAEGQNDTSNCLEFVRVFKQRTAFEWKRRTGARLWQESFFDHVLRSDETTQRSVRYVLENSVRAGLVTEPSIYPHSGSLLYERCALIEWAFGWGGGV